MQRRVALGVTLLLLAATATIAAPAAGAATTSSNWAGYAVAGTARFTSVTGHWVVPAAACSVGGPSFAGFWVGLGGNRRTSTALEQIGTDSNCAASGRALYSAWYELVPAGPVTLRLRVHAGDSLSAAVSVSGRRVTLRLLNQTTGVLAVRHATMLAPDTSSAEWIAEAPSQCGSDGNCTPLPLANFTRVTFSGASATAGGRTGAISDPAWSASMIRLLEDPGLYRRGRTASIASAALPSGLFSAGAAFSVTWRQISSSSAPAPGAFLPGDQQSFATLSQRSLSARGR